MSKEDFELVLNRVGLFQGSVHLHGFGEPLLDRNLILKARRLKETWPDSSCVIFSTLGLRIDDFEALALSGIDVINVSFYGFSKEGYQEIHGRDEFERVRENLKELSKAIQRTGSSLKICVKLPSPSLSSTLPIAFSRQTLEFLDWLKTHNLEAAAWPVVHNYGEGRSFNPPAESILCPVIEGKRRNILNITWDLNVIPCCFDFNASIRFGNLRSQTIEEIFSGPEYLNFVIAHRTGGLEAYSPCINCEKNDYL